VYNVDTLSTTKTTHLDVFHSCFRTCRKQLQI